MTNEMNAVIGIAIPFLGTSLGAACVFFMKRALGDLVRRALAIVVFYILILLGGTIALSLIEGDAYSMLDLLFESTSALATVGVSSIGTPNLKPLSHCVLVPMMYIGRIGPLTMALALASRQGRTKTKIRSKNAPLPKRTGKLPLCFWILPWTDARIMRLRF